MKNQLVKINADIFVIPNHACTIDGFCCNQNSIRNAGKNILNYTGKELTQDEMYVETWMISKEIGCDNISDHGFMFTIGNQYYYSRPGTISRFVPKSALPRKEGEKSFLMYRDIKAIPVSTLGDLSQARINRNANTINVDLLIEVTANQHDYRYCSFGNFEDVVNRVCR